MDVPDGVRETARELTAAANETMKKKGGWRRVLGHFLGEFLEVGTGAVAGYMGSKAARHVELKKAEAKAEELRAAGKHEEANSFLNAMLTAWTLKDEAAEFKAFPRAVEHFNRTGEQDKATQMLSTFFALDIDALNRIGEILLNAGNEDDQYRYLVNWGKATAEQQQMMLRITRIAIVPEDHPSQVFATELRRTLIEQRDLSNAEVNWLVAEIDRKREARRRAREARRQARNNPNA